ISPPSKMELPVADLTNFHGIDQEAELNQLLEEKNQQPFDLAKGPLFRVHLIILAEDEHVLVLSMHHIISDGWSMGVFFREFEILYQAFQSGKDVQLEFLPIQYADFAVWQQQWINNGILDTLVKYWKKKLSDLSTLQLITDRPRPTIQTFIGAGESLVLSPKISKALNQLSQREGVTLYMTLLAAFSVLLHHYTNQEDIIVGSPIANRNRPEVEGLIGFFVNMLVMRSNVSVDMSLRDVLAHVRETALGAYEYQDLPFEKLVEALDPERNMSHTPLFQVTFALQSTSMLPKTLGDMALGFIPVKLQNTRFDLEVDVWEGQEELTVRFIYNVDLFDAATINRMIQQYKSVLKAIVTDLDQYVGDVALLTDTELQKMLVEWNITNKNYSREKNVHELFAEQTKRTPDALAIIHGDKQLTYGQLDAQSNQLAHFLKKYGVSQEMVVCICLPRSVELVVGILGILKAGGAYVPLDPHYPEDRLMFMIKDTNTPLLLTNESIKSRISENKIPTVCL
ncbi:MAG: AMP-binding protein, partial [Desulfobulbaceae bacterium]|nr:AMP-binding protein [Desulfobulbaceae bacterium]